MKKKVIIRADGSKGIGMGHLSRASLITEHFSNNGTTAKIIMKDDTNGKNFILNRTTQYQCLPIDVSLNEELEITYNLLADEAPCFFILDVLNHDKYQEMLNSLKEIDCLSVVITDESEKTTIEADIVLNGNPHQLDYSYANSPGSYLMGPEYFIMDPNYEKIAVEEPRKSIENILLTVGGSDHHNLLFMILDALEVIHGNYNVKIFSTYASGYIDDLKKYLDKLTISTQLYLDEKTLAPFWADCDVAITAGGNTLFERISTRLPGGTVCQLKRQMEIANYFEKLEVNYNLGLGVELNEKCLFERLKVFLNNYAMHYSQYTKSPQVTEGRGLHYLTQAIKDFQCD